MLKVQSAEMVHRVVDRAIQVHGGMGLARELPLETMYREARMFRITEGSSEVLAGASRATSCAASGPRAESAINTWCEPQAPPGMSGSVRSTEGTGRVAEPCCRYYLCPILELVTWGRWVISEMEIMRTHPVRERSSRSGSSLRASTPPSRCSAARCCARGRPGQAGPGRRLLQRARSHRAPNLGNSLLLNKRREFRQGDVIYSVVCNPMLTIVGYSNDVSYSYGPMCSEELATCATAYRDRNCRETSPWRSRRGGSTAADPERVRALHARGGRGRRRDGDQGADERSGRLLRHAGADQMDLLVAISNCPQERNPCNGFDPTPMGIIIYE